MILLVSAALTRGDASQRSDRMAVHGRVLLWTVRLLATIFVVIPYATSGHQGPVGLEVGALPAINFDADEGFGYGVIVETYSYGDRALTPYEWTVQPTVFLTTGGAATSCSSANATKNRFVGRGLLVWNAKPECRSTSDSDTYTERGRREESRRPRRRSRHEGRRTTLLLKPLPSQARHRRDRSRGRRDGSPTPPYWGPSRPA